MTEMGHEEPFAAGTPSLRNGSKAVGIGPSRSVHGTRVWVRAVYFCVFSAEPIGDEADNLFGNCLRFTRLLAGGRELVRLWAAREAAGQRVSAAA